MCKKKVKKQRAIAKKSAIEVLAAQEITPPVAHVAALARADAVVRAAGGVRQGLIPSQRASHGSAWQNLMNEDQAIRGQILEVKAKENRVLEMIRDQLAADLVDTLDTAIEQGVLNSPEEV